MATCIPQKLWHTENQKKLNWIALFKKVFFKLEIYMRKTEYVYVCT